MPAWTSRASTEPRVEAGTHSGDSVARTRGRPDDGMRADPVTGTVGTAARGPGALPARSPGTQTDGPAPPRPTHTPAARPAAPQRRRSPGLHPLAKPLLAGLALLPLGGLVLGIVQDSLGANPAEALIRQTGDWTLRLLLLTLCITPLRELLQQPALARFRRMLGLFTFFYALLHLSAYAWLDMGLDPAALVRDVLKRPFILVGSLTLLLLTALAATSFNAAIRRLGAARWQALHRSVYAALLLALLHFFWMRAGKQDFAEVAVHAALAALLLGWRLQRALRRRRAD